MISYEAKSQLLVLRNALSMLHTLRNIIQCMTEIAIVSPESQLSLQNERV